MPHRPLRLALIVLPLAILASAAAAKVAVDNDIKVE